MLDTKLEGKLVLITGSTAGIGKEIASKFLNENAKVILHGRSAEKLKLLQSAFIDQYPRTQCFTLLNDLSTGPDEFIKSFEKLREENGLDELDVLVLNQSLYERKNFFELEKQGLMKLYELNTANTAIIAQYFLSNKLKKNSGNILIIGSNSAYRPKKEMLHYSMTKTAQLALARGMAELTAGSKVRVNLIAPGPTKTEGLVDFMKKYAEDKKIPYEEAENYYMQTVEPTSLLKRLTTAEEIANIAVFVCSELATAINGRNWLVDGGIVDDI